MKCLTILFLKFLLLSNFVMADTTLTKSMILKQTSDCMKDSRTQICKELVSEIEKLQLVVFEVFLFQKLILYIFGFKNL